MTARDNARARKIVRNLQACAANPAGAAMPIGLLPRPSLLTHAVVAMSIVSGLAAGVLTGGVILLAAKARRS